eukprot:GHUV01005096.1.p1 GENE.GHUV01005096.1~~GHUV01005096.1.p1  ORF type:complete len:906 (+),score=289.25 GHUV01005096.1:167-2884(+)
MLSLQAVSSWLRQYLPFNLLSNSSVKLLAELMEVEFLPAGKILGREGTNPAQLVVVRQGSVKVTGSNMPVPIDAGPGATFFLIELLLGQNTNTTVKTTSDCTLWVVPSAALLALAARRPDFVLELGLKMSQEMAGKVEQMEANMQSEERRNRALQPYRVTTPRRGIVGNSKYADRLRRQIVSAARDPTRRSVLIFGEPGLCKDNIAALLHFGSPDRLKPMVQVDCTEMDPFMTELFGRGSREGLLHWIRDGTLAIYNVHKAAPHMIPQLRQLLETGVYQPAPAPVPLGSIDFPQAERQANCRIIMTAAQRVKAFDGLTTVVQAPPLRVRPADIIDLERYFLKVISKRSGVKLTLTPEAERQLITYTFPNNITELEAVVERAAVQASSVEEGEPAAQTPAATPQRTDAKGRYTGVSRSTSGSLALDKDVFWFAAQSKDRFRWNMLNSLPLLRQFLRSDVFPELINHKVVKPIFAVVVALLFIGPQDRAHNFCLSLFWNYWWPLMFVIYPFLGRIWCSICPFMIYGEVMQRWRMASGVVLRRWPREELERWGGWFLFALFAGILVWEEVWELQDTAYLSSWLLLIITGGAVICSAFFERRLWCRYLCPIGGMNGLFAKLSMTELRARQGVCSGTCHTYHCYKGGPAEPPEGLETLGCPVYSHPAQLTDNRNCVLCMTCLKACPHRSIEVRLRLPGVDLWSDHKATWYEVMLQFMLLGAVYLHRLPELEDQFGVDPVLLADKAPHILASIGVMAVPGLIAWGSDAVMRLAFNNSKRAAAAPAVAGGAAALAGTAAAPVPIAPFLNLSYGYLPLVWGATLSHYLRQFLEEAGNILPVTAATFGLDGSSLPSVTADHAVTEFLQGSTLLAGAFFSLLATRKVGARPWLVLAPQCLTILGFTAELWYLVVR